MDSEPGFSFILAFAKLKRRYIYMYTQKEKLLIATFFSFLKKNNKNFTIYKTFFIFATSRI